MSLIRYLRRWTIPSLVVACAACTTAHDTASPASQPPDSKPAGGACQTSNGLVANGNVIYKCVLPGQGFINCPQYVCQQCNNGTFGGEHSCMVR